MYLAQTVFELALSPLILVLHLLMSLALCTGYMLAGPR